MFVFKLQGYVGSFQTIITKTDVVTNDLPICNNEGRNYLYSSNKHTLFSPKNEDKSNEVVQVT